MRRCATMCDMSERPEQRPEGRLIAVALKRSPLSARKAAEQAGMSEGHWRAIVSGSRSVGRDMWVPVRGPAETLARMAKAVGVTPEQLLEAGRDDAAEELRQLLAETTPPERAQDSSPALADLPTDRDERVAELSRRLADLAAELQATTEQRRSG